MKARLCRIACFAVLSSLLVSAPVAAAPHTQPTPLTYDELVDRAVAARAQLAMVEKETQATLKSLSGVIGPDADTKRKELLVRRRLADRQAWLAGRRIKMHWLQQLLPEPARKELADLTPAEEDELLDTRTVAQRLAVPLPPKTFEKATIEEVLAYIDKECDVAVVADWPMLKNVGVSKIDVISLEIGKYDKPALETLKTVVFAIAKDLATVDTRQADSVLISTKEGVSKLSEMDRLLGARVKDRQLWSQTPLLQPISFTQVPLAEVIDRVAAAHVRLEVQWGRLAPLGIKPETPISVTLGVHRVGHALALVSDVLNAVAQQPGTITFDVTPEQVVVLSDKRGLIETLAAADWLATAVAKEEAMQAALSRPVPELRTAGVSAGEVVQYLRDFTEIEIKPDWVSLAGSGISEKSPLMLDLINAPPSQVLRLVFTPPAGKPPVVWKVEGKTLVVRSTAQ